MVSSATLARRLCGETGSPHPKILWDPANACWYGEEAFPRGYEAVRGHLGHVHVEDVAPDPPAGYLEVRPLGEGVLAPHLAAVAQALRHDGYAGVVSFESVHHPGDGDFEAGFRRCIGRSPELFGDG